MKFFNFERLIKKYSRPFTLYIKSKGDYDSKGDWVEGSKHEVTLSGAIMALSESKVNNSNGIYTTKDKALYLLSPIDNALLYAEVVFCGNVYRIESITEADDSDFTGVFHYTMKWVSIFDNKED